MLIDCGWVESAPEDALLLLLSCSSMDLDRLQTLKSNRNLQLVSRIKGTNFLTNPVEFHRLLKQNNSTHLQTKTYDLAVKQDCIEFFEKASKSTDFNVEWVLRSNEETTQTRVIKDVNKFRNLRQQMSFSKQDPCISSEEIIQLRLNNPLIIKQKKVQVRSYFLIASVNPLVVLFRDGVALLTSDLEKSDEKDLNLNDIDIKLTLPELNDMMMENQQTSNPNWASEYLRPYMQNITRNIVAHIQDNLDDRVGRFEFLAFDVVVSKQLEVFVTNVDCGPKLTINNVLRPTDINDIIGELMNIVLEVNALKQSGIPILKLKSTRKFEPIILGE